MGNLLTVIYRLTFIVAFALVSLAVAEGVVQLFGRGITQGAYSAGRLLEFSGITIAFVIALLLREIREELQRRRG